MPSHTPTHADVRAPAPRRCPPCQAFTPQLVKAYQKLQAAGKQLEIIFISSDRDMGQFSQYFATMPWLAIPPGDERRAPRALVAEQYAAAGRADRQGGARGATARTC